MTKLQLILAVLIGVGLAVAPMIAGRGLLVAYVVGLLLGGLYGNTLNDDVKKGR